MQEVRLGDGRGTGDEEVSLDPKTIRKLNQLTEYRRPTGLVNGAPSSREINLAIEVLARSGIPELTLMALDIWNASRIRKKAPKQPTPGDIQRLIAGLDRQRLSEAGIL